MITKMFSVFDSKAAFYGTPFFMPNEAMAMRAFGDLVNDQNSSIAKHPEDYSLFFMGIFDDNVGTLKEVVPTCLVTASSLLKVNTLNLKAPGLKEMKEIVNGKVLEEVVS